MVQNNAEIITSRSLTWPQEFGLSINGMNTELEDGLQLIALSNYKHKKHFEIKIK